MPPSAEWLAALKPPQNYGMKELDRTKFERSFPLVVAQIEDPRMLSRIIKEGSTTDLLDLARAPTIVVMGEDRKQRGVLLAPHITEPQHAAEQLSPGTLDLLQQARVTFKTWQLSLGYEYWTAEDILKSVLPPELGDAPSGFALVGHIAHINLQDQFLPYKHLIGQVILDKNQPSVRTVVNKLQNIHSVYRTFDMEVIAGVPEFVVVQHESNCRFQFDFRKVYWNSRLHTEHERLVNEFGENKAICDPMAGVGPFAIPAAKRGNIVFANDLNPSSYEAMNENIALNKLNPEIMPTYNEDGRVFIQKSIERLHKYREQHTEAISITPPRKKVAVSSPSAAAPAATSTAPSTAPSKRKSVERKVEIPEVFSHYVMNLPASAIEFLDGFIGLYAHAKFSTPDPPLPTIHVHCFYKFEAHQDEPPRDVVQASIAKRVSKALHFEIDPDRLSLHDVRRVAPTKDMYEVSFVLPREVAYMQQKG